MCLCFAFFHNFVKKNVNLNSIVILLDTSAMLLEYFQFKINDIYFLVYKVSDSLHNHIYHAKNTKHF